MNRLFAAVGVVLAFGGCSANAPAPAPEQKAPSEIPITSKSPEAIDHFKKGRDLADNIRPPEAAQEFNQAIKLDPDFALALVYRGSVTPGPEGLKDMEAAAEKAASASKPEQLMIAAMLAGRRGEFSKSAEQWKQLTEMVPRDARAHMGRGAQLYSVEKYADAIESLNKATELNPQAGPAYNMIGYAHLVQGDAARAVEALKKYAALAPNEPNPQDSLGEALMASSQHAEAEASFQKAIDLSPQFGVAWEGIAYTRFFRGDWRGGQSAVAKAREAASRPPDRINANRLGAYGTLAAGKTTEGLKQLEQLAASSDATPVNAAILRMDRAAVLAEQARYRDVLGEAAKALQSADSLPPGAAANLRRIALVATVSAQAKMGDAQGAEMTVASLQKEASSRPDDPLLTSALHLAQGMHAAAQKDMKAARVHFDMCSQRDFVCHWQAVEVARKSGDSPAAEASLARLTKIYVRDPMYLYARSTVMGGGGRRTN